MTKNRNALGDTPEEFIAFCRQSEAARYPIRKWRVIVGASKASSIDALYVIKREYTVEAREPDVYEAAIARAYEDGDIEHARVEFRQLIKD